MPWVRVMSIRSVNNMIVENDFLNRLKDFGLNTYESKLWVALLSRGVSTAGELSDIAGVPRSRSYDVLESLEKKGFIVMKLGKPIKYIAVQPAEVVERVQKKIKTDAEKQAQMIENLKKSEVLGELNTLHTHGLDLIDPTNLSAALKGRTNVYHQMETMIKGAKKSVLIMTTEEGLVRKAKSLKKSLKKAQEKGVKVKIVSPVKMIKNKEYAGLAEMKYSADASSRFCVIDNEEILFMLMDDKGVHPTYDIGIWVKSPYFVKGFMQMTKNSLD